MSSLVRLNRPQKRRLQRIVQRSQDARPVRRVQVVLQLASGVGVTEISDALSVARSTVYRWATQFMTLGEACLSACHSGRRAYTVDATLRDESPRYSRRLQTLRDWSHEKTKALFTGSPGTSGQAAV